MLENQVGTAWILKIRHNILISNDIWIVRALKFSYMSLFNSIFLAQNLEIHPSLQLTQASFRRVVNYSWGGEVLSYTPCHVRTELSNLHKKN